MPEVLIWILLGWLVVSLFSRSHGFGGAARVGCGGRRGAFERRQHPRAPVGPPSARHPDLHRNLRRAHQNHVPQHPSAQRPPTLEEKEARLRSRYVSGEITVHDYERGLDELYRRP